MIRCHLGFRRLNLDDARKLYERMTQPRRPKSGFGVPWILSQSSTCQMIGYTVRLRHAGSDDGCFHCHEVHIMIARPEAESGSAYYVHV